MSNRTASTTVTVVVTVLLLACALTTTGLAIRREFRSARPAAARTALEKQGDWAEYAAEGHRIGPANAKVVLIEFADFQCPACRTLEGRLRETRKRFPDDFAVVYRHFPLNIHRFAREAAFASECSARQGRFEQMHDALFDLRDSIGVVPWPSLGAKVQIPDIPAFSKCMADTSIAAIVDRDVAAAKRLNARGTPTLLINGVRATGTLPQATLDSLVTAAIQGPIVERNARK